MTCDYALSAHFLEVRITSSFELAQVRRAGSALRVRNASAVSTRTSNPPGLTPTVTNTDVISITSAARVFNNTVIIEDAAGLAPGFTQETGDDEIEIFVNLRGGANSLLSVRVGGFPGKARFGTSGVNSNASPGEDTPDVDIFPIDVPRLDGRGGFTTAVNFSAQGGAATGGPLAAPIEFQGSTVADVLVGGEGNDRLEAYGGADLLQGAGGDDDLIR